MFPPSVKRFVDEFYCCVFGDKYSDNRCCHFRTDGEDNQFCVGAYPSENPYMSVIRITNYLLIATVAIFGCAGFACLCMPERVIFATLLNDRYKSSFGNEEVVVQLMDEQHQLETQRPQNVFESVLQYLNQDPNPEKKERLAQQITAEMKKLENKRPEVVAMVAPTQVLGALFLYIAVKALIYTQMTFEIKFDFPFKDFAAMYVSVMIGATVGASSRDEGKGSPTFFTMTIFICLLMTCAFLYTETRAVKIRATENDI